MTTSEEATGPSNGAIPAWLAMLIALLLILCFIVVGYAIFVWRAGESPIGFVDVHIRDVRTQLEERPNDVDLLLELAFLYDQGDDSAAALDTLESAAQIAPDDPRPHYRRALVLQRIGEVDGARESFLMAWRIDSCDPMYAVEVAEIRFAERDPAGVVEVLESVTEQHPTYSDVSIILGRAYTQLGYVEEAVGAYRNALKYDPGSQEAIDGLKQVLDDGSEVGDE